MIESLTNGIIATIHDDNIKELGRKSALDFTATILCKDPVAMIESVNDIRKLLWQIPNAIFWDKMRRFLLGTYSDYEHQIKMCQKFNKDNKQYKEFVKKQIQIIEKLDFDCKVDWFSNLTRALLLEFLNEEEYFKLTFALRMISTEDLLFLRKLISSKNLEENNVLSVFYQYSLVSKITPTTLGEVTSLYNITDLGTKLLKYGIDFC